MACCCANEVEPEKEDEEEELEGPLENRSCTDVIFLIAFIIAIFGMIILFGYGLMEGNPNRFIRGYDVSGDICGQENDPNKVSAASGKNLANNKTMYIDFVRTAILSGNGEFDDVINSLSLTIPAGAFNLNIPDSEKINYCLTGSTGSAPTSGVTDTTTATASSSATTTAATTSAVASGRRKRQLENSTQVWKTSKIISPGGGILDLVLHGKYLCKYCVQECPPNFSKFLSRCIPSIVKPESESTTNGEDFVQSVARDVEATGSEIIIICFIAIALSILMTVAFKIFSQIIVYAIIGLVIVAMLSTTIILWVIWGIKNTDYNAQQKEGYTPPDQTTFFGRLSTAHSQTETVYYLIGAIISTVVLVVILIVLLVLRKRIELVIQLFKEAGKAIQAMPLLVLLPLGTVLLQLMVAGLWIFATLWIESTGEPEIEGSGGYVSYNKWGGIAWLRWYHLFGLLWMEAFIVAAQHMAVSGAVAGWYFSKDKSEVGVNTILKSIYRLLRYHLGTIAFGSLVIAIIQLIRMILKSMEYVIKSQAGEKNALGKFLLILLKCIDCCLGCFERVMKYLSVNAYIETAIYGYNFCRAATKAFQLLTSNALRVAAINSVGVFVLFLGKLVVILLTFAIAIQIIEVKTETEYIEHAWAPVLIGVCFAYLTVHSFISIYDITIDTIFLCFCEDCERNNGIDKPYYMSKGLMEFAENSKKALEVLEKRQDNEVDDDKQIMIQSTEDIKRRDSFD